MIETLSPEAVEAFLLAQRVGRVGCHDGGTTYVVPVIYAWSDPLVHVYTTEGMKVDFMRANPAVCFEVDEYRPGGSWRSVIIQGLYEEVQGDEAAATLALLSARLAPTGTATRRERPRGEGRVPVAFRVRAHEVTGRAVER